MDDRPLYEESASGSVGSRQHGPSSHTLRDSSKAAIERPARGETRTASIDILESACGLFPDDAEISVAADGRVIVDFFDGGRLVLNPASTLEQPAPGTVAEHPLVSLTQILASPYEDAHLALDENGRMALNFDNGGRIVFLESEPYVPAIAEIGKRERMPLETVLRSIIQLHVARRLTARPESQAGEPEPDNPPGESDDSEVVSLDLANADFPPQDEDSFSAAGNGEESSSTELSANDNDEDSPADAEAQQPRILNAKGAAHGTVTVVDGRYITYKPGSGFGGTDQFYFTMADRDTHAIRTAEVRITVASAGNETTAKDSIERVCGDGGLPMDSLMDEIDLDSDLPTVIAVTHGATGKATIDPAGTVVTYTPVPAIEASGPGYVTYTIGGNDRDASRPASVSVSAAADDAEDGTQQTDPEDRASTSRGPSASPASGFEPGTPTMIAVNDVIVDERSRKATFVIDRYGDLSTSTSVTYETGDFFSSQPDAFTGKRGTLKFAPGETSAVIVVSLTDNEFAQNGEPFLVRLGSAEGATIIDNIGVGVLVDNSTGKPAEALEVERPLLALKDLSVDLETGWATFFVTRSGNTTVPVQVTYDAGDLSPSERPTSTGFLYFGPGEIAKALVVEIPESMAKQPDALFVVQLRDAVGAVIIDDTGVAELATGETVGWGRAGTDPVISGDGSGYTFGKRLFVHDDVGSAAHLAVRAGRGAPAADASGDPRFFLLSEGEFENAVRSSESLFPTDDTADPSVAPTARDAIPAKPRGVIDAFDAPEMPAQTLMKKHGGILFDDLMGMQGVNRLKLVDIIAVGSIEID